MDADDLLQATDETADEWAPSGIYRSVGRLTTWLMFLGTLAGLGAALAVGVGIAASVHRHSLGIIFGLAGGLLAGLVVATPYLVVVAGLDLLNRMNERLGWIAESLDQQRR